MHSDHLKGLLSLHGGLLLFGGTALFSQTLHLNALDMTAWRCLIAGVLLLGWLRLRNKKIGFAHNHHNLGILGLSVLMGLHWVTYFHSMQIAGVTVGILSLFTFPVMTVLLEPVFDRARLKGKDLFAALLVVSGVSLMTPSLNPDDPIALGVFWGVISAFLFTLRNLFMKKYYSQYSPVQTMGWQSLLVAIMLLPFVSGEVLSLPGEQWFQLFLLATVFTAAPHTLLASSLRYLKAASISLISCLQPVYGALLAFLILGEQAQTMTLIGGSLIIAAAVNETLSKKQT
ncbi:DMT family transporter [Oceanospirillum sp.]|uniref:DMT family transporter n=1 Tax=Oceanospirillum sp. TaxID=2021254 RepID=UPI003A93A286